MSTKEQKQTTAAQGETPGTNPDAPKATVTEYEQKAQLFRQTLATLAATIPNFGSPDAAGAKAARHSANVPHDFLAVAVDALDQTTDLQALSSLDIDVAKAKLQFVAAYTPALPDLEGVVRILKNALIGAKADLATNSRQIYGLTKTLSLGRGAASILPRVHAMKRALRRPRPNAQPAPSASKNTATTS